MTIYGGWRGILVVAAEPTASGSLVCGGGAVRISAPAMLETHDSPPASTPSNGLSVLGLNVVMRAPANNHEARRPESSFCNGANALAGAPVENTPSALMVENSVCTDLRLEISQPEISTGRSTLPAPVSATADSSPGTLGGGRGFYNWSSDTSSPGRADGLTEHRQLFDPPDDDDYAEGFRFKYGLAQ